MDGEHKRDPPREWYLQRSKYGPQHDRSQRVQENVDHAIAEGVELPKLVFEPVRGEGDGPVVDLLRRLEPNAPQAIFLEYRI